MKDDILGWSQWNETFQPVTEVMSIAELHGLMMGIVCIAEAPHPTQWLQILALLKLPSLSDTSVQFLTEEAEEAANALQDAELDYFPILPDDHHPLAERVQALADWCAGVVLGIGLATQQLKDDEKESIEILQHVASIEFDSSDNDEEGEAAYEELYEHVRLIPVQFSLGRPQKLVVANSPLLQSSTKATTPSTPDDSVEVFHPPRLS